MHSVTASGVADGTAVGADVAEEAPGAPSQATNSAAGRRAAAQGHGIVRARRNPVLPAPLVALRPAR